MSADAPEGCSDDAFLGGRLRLWQPRRGFRSGSDAVLLAAAVPARPGDRVLELGLGTGAASLCLGARVAGLALTGLELRPEAARLARLNAARNGQALQVIEGDVAALPEALRRERFDHVLCNPPWFAAARSRAQDAGREAGRGGGPPLAVWVAAALARLRPGGHLCLLLPTARLPELLAALPATGARLRPLAGRPGQPARRLLALYRKDSRAALALLPPLALHAAGSHAEGGGAYAPWAEAVLRDAAALGWEAGAPPSGADPVAPRAHRPGAPSAPSPLPAAPDLCAPALAKGGGGLAAPVLSHAVILAGGRGLRMGGVDKALLPLAGAPLIAHCLARLRPQVRAVAIAAGTLAGAEARFAALGPLPLLADPPLSPREGGSGERRGPLAGILAGMLWARAQGAASVLAVPTDSPFFPPDLALRLARAAAKRPDAPALAASDSGRHPVFGLWPVALAEPLAAALAASERRVGMFAAAHGAQWVRFEGGPADPFLNLNTAEDLQQAERLLDSPAPR